MHGYILLIILSILGALNTICSKKFQQGFKMDFDHFALYILASNLFASLYFSSAAGFKIEMNRVTFIFSAVYAAIVCASLLLNLCAMSRISVSLVSITSTSGSIIFSALFGIIFLKDAVTFPMVMSVILILTAILFPYFKLSKSVLDKNGLLICALLFVFSGAAVILTKLYTLTPGVCDSKSYFFMTNIILLSASSILFFFNTKKKKIKISCALRTLSGKQLIFIAAITVLSNISSVISVIAISKVNISIYTVVSSSLGIISAALLSRFYFKEYMPIENWISVILAVLAIAASNLK